MMNSPKFFIIDARMIDKQVGMTGLKCIQHFQEAGNFIRRCFPWPRIISIFNTALLQINMDTKLHKKGYQVSSNIDGITGIKSGKLAGFLNETPAQERGDLLTRTALTAIDILKQNKKGFFLMIEGSKIDDGGHGNNLDVVINEMIDFDNTIGHVLEFAEKDGNTLVIITGDHETGGLTLTGGSLGGKIEGKFSTKGHTAVMVPVFAYGPGAEAFMGIYHNNTIFDKMKHAFNF